MTTTAQTTRTEFTPFPLAGIIPDAFPEVDLYLPAVDVERAPLYRARGTQVDAKDMQALRSRGIDELWVLGDDQAEISAFLANHLGTILANDANPPRERVKLLNQVVAQTLRDSMTCEDPASAVTATAQLAEHLVTISLHSDLAIRDVAKVAKHDFCTFTHSANVACYSTLLARLMGVTDEAELREIAVAGMLHDLGKLEIPHAILTKPTKLTNEEFGIIKLHPTRGFQMLRNKLNPAQLMMVYQHHEKIDGTGYPVGLVGNEIHFWGKICAVADVFEALTGKRPYRRPNTATEALTIMRRGAGSHFDREVLHRWQSNFIREAAE
jgi:HD-GYP domain-containing protein (c-di-GMP phosphodiesterase class II)